MTLDLTAIRKQFPALQRQSLQPNPTIYLDNPGGTQVAQPVLDRMAAYLVDCNANHGGAFQTSRISDEILDEAHRAMADFYHARRPEEIIFGNNMTTLTLHISRSISRQWNAGDEIVVTRLDHDANLTPWVLAAQDRGCRVTWVDFDPSNGTLRLDELEQALQRKPKLLAVGYASNALGTINPLGEIIPMAHAAGTLVYVDAVQYAPHGPIDVQELGCDFLVSSAYKFFGPHAGILYGRYDLLDELYAYKVRPATNELPGKFETGTQNHEGLAGVLGALEYLEWVGESFGQEYRQQYAGRYTGRALRLKQAMAAIRDYELGISRMVLDILQETPGLTLYGLADENRLGERVPTFSFTLQNWQPRQVAEAMAQQGINLWDGNYYALAITERLGLEGQGGMVRVGPAHYNTVEEIDKFGQVLRSLPGGR
jgi:cysteine desulfurase family protein (TIGR01976 family)